MREGMGMRTFHIQNFGCRATQADGAAIETLLAQRGLAAADGAAGADLVVLNTCTVTSNAEVDVRNAVRRVHRANPGARILVTGCYAQRAPQELAALPGVSWVVGNSHKTRIPEIVEESAGAYHGQIHIGDIYAEREFLSMPVEAGSGDRTRPNLKIQDGCNNRCSFCIIPSVRGYSRSMPADEVVRQVRGLSRGYREVVLTGINLGRWGRESGTRPRLADLLGRLLEETDVERLRISSVEPMDWSDELIGRMAGSPRIARHIHMPLQSGSDAVLKRMRRRYRARHYRERLARAHAAMPEAGVGADVMTGFPGETESEFQETVALVESLPFTYLHVFTYSERPSTDAAALGGQVPHQVRKRRTRLLREIAARKNLEFRRRMVGRTLSSVTLTEPRIALSGNYLRIEMAVAREPNCLVNLRIGGVSEDGLAEAVPFPVLPAASSR